MRRETRDGLRHKTMRLWWLCAIPLLVSCLMSHVTHGAAPRPRQQPRSRIVVVKAVTAVPVSERAYAASLAEGTVGILARNGVKADLVADGALEVLDWTMSCRVAGRGLEERVWEAIASVVGACRVRATWRRTAKNAPVADLFDRLGFGVTAAEEGEKRSEQVLG